MAIPVSKSASSAIIGIYRLLLAVFIIGCLYYGQSLFIPLTLAALLTFLLSPLVTRLEYWLGKILAILLVVVMVFIFVGTIGYVLTNQVVDFTTKLPDYKINIEHKLNAFHIPQDSPLTRILDTVDQLKKHLPGQIPNKVKNLSSADQPVPVNIIANSTTDLTIIIKNFSATLLDFIGSTGLVFLLLIFMLLCRQDLRGRLIRLIGSHRISATTRAMDDAGQRVAQYLMSQLLLNFVYGIFIAIGLYFIGVPNAILWGGLAFLLRFIPYLGAWIAAILPFIVALATSNSWLVPVLTIILFGSLDLVTANFVEPLLYSTRTGVSAFALIVSPIFWLLLCGPIGLLLSVPITVCLVVMGRHIPNLSFLSVVLGDEKALALYEECYQRLVVGEITEALGLINNYLKNNSLINLYDVVFIPMLSAAETDHRQELLDDDQLAYLYQNIQDILEDLDQNYPILSSVASKDNTNIVSDFSKILCVPLETEQDELANTMLVQVLNRSAFNATNLTIKSTYEEISSTLENEKIVTIFISVVDPSSFIPVRKLSAYLHHKFPKLKIILGLWGFEEINSSLHERLKLSGIEMVIFSLENAVNQLKKSNE